MTRPRPWEPRPTCPTCGACEKPGCACEGCSCPTPAAPHTCKVHQREMVLRDLHGSPHGALWRCPVKGCFHIGTGEPAAPPDPAEIAATAEYWKGQYHIINKENAMYRDELRKCREALRKRGE